VKTPVDVNVTNHGTLFLFELVSHAAREWVEENVSGETTWWGENSLVVEHRYAGDLATGMVSDGLVLA